MHLAGSSFLDLADFNSEQILEFLEISSRVKREKNEGRRLQRFAGYSLAMVFEKQSTRTRCAFESAFGEEGGHPVFLGANDIHLGKKESLEDSARVFGGMFDILAYRGHGQNIVETLSQYAGIPVINALTNEYHPTQVLADLLTLQEEFKTIKGLKLAFMGDGNCNVAHTILQAAAIMGFHCSIICPKEYAPQVDLLTHLAPLAKANGAQLEVCQDLKQGLVGADAVYTDVWVSMGQEAEATVREGLLAPYQVNQNAMNLTGKSSSIFMHCLPAIKGKEVSFDVMEGQQSRVWVEAANRKHTIKAIILALLGLA